MTTVNDIYLNFQSVLSIEYEPAEAEQIAILVFEHVMAYKRLDISLNRFEQLSELHVKSFEKILNKLQEGSPVQYVLGNAWFCGMNLFVNEHVLIPRRETEELVEWVIKDIHSSGNKPAVIFDICTGSGCIALALKNEFMNLKIVAADISDEALYVAQQNSINNNLKVEFVKLDALNLTTNIRPDIVVCNPPYVLYNEKSVMKKNVTEHEPALALFVPDTDPLVFYRHISEWVNKSLNSGSKIYFEINEQMAMALEKLLSEMGLINIEFRKDMQDKDRMVKATKK